MNIRFAGGNTAPEIRNMGRRSGKAGVWLWVSAALFLTGCFERELPAFSSQETGNLEETAPAASVETETKPSAAAGKTRREGSISKENKNLLTQAQWSAILAYMDRYYESLAALEWKDPGDLFADSAAAWRAFNGQTWQYEIQLRVMQKSDLRLDGYVYELQVEEVRQQEDGTVSADIAERSIQNFSQHPWIDSEYPMIRHHFLLENQEGKWYLKEHVQSDGIYWNMYKDFRDQDFEKMENAEETFKKHREALLEEVKEGMAEREAADGLMAGQSDGTSARQSDEPMARQTEESSARRSDGSPARQSEEPMAGQTNVPPNVDHEYDREAATAYAERYVGFRNSRWPDFSHQGGNCQNFASQCLLDGGIPMDLEGKDVWSWTGSSDAAEGPEDTVSWINVAEFNRYAQNNRGYGLAARPDAAFYSGETGDLIKMRTSANWSHVVVITDLVTDENGELIDYIICSNTTDVKRFPVSAYPMPYQSLTRIYGWNEEENE